MKLKLKATLADDEIENIKDISVSVDCSWQCRGYSSGRMKSWGTPMGYAVGYPDYLTDQM